METTIYFIRHGEVDNPMRELYGRQLDLPMTEKGRAQVGEIARTLHASGIQVDAIYSSSLSRGKDSAAIIAEELGSVETYEDDDLLDSHIPAVAGKPFSLREALFPKRTDEYTGDYVKQGNESREDIVERMMRAYKKIHRESIGKTVLIVGHGDPLRFLLYRLTHPQDLLPSIGELIASYYPDNGEGWRMVVDEDGRIKEMSFVTREGTIKLEREV